METRIIVCNQLLTEALKYIKYVDGKHYRYVMINTIQGNIVLEYITLSNTQLIRFVIPAHVDRPLQNMVALGAHYLYNHISVSYDEYDSIVFDITEREKNSEELPSIVLMNTVNLNGVSHKWERGTISELDYTWFTFHTSAQKLYNFCNHPAVKHEFEIVLSSDKDGQHLKCGEYTKQLCNYPDTELKEVKLSTNYLLDLVKPMKRNDIVEIGGSTQKNNPGPIRISNGFRSVYLAPRWND